MDGERQSKVPTKGGGCVNNKEDFMYGLNRVSKTPTVEEIKVWCWVFILGFVVGFIIF